MVLKICCIATYIVSTASTIPINLTIIPDSLQTKSFQYLSDQVLLNREDKMKALQYSQYWLTKAKRENNLSQIPLAYNALLHSTPKEYQLVYADSILQSALVTKNDKIIGSAYMTKGIVFYENKLIKEALDNYLAADQYLLNVDDQYLKHKLKYGIGITKYYLGLYDEAISLLSECIVFFAEENDRAYLNSLHALSLSYSMIGNYNSSSLINAKGIVVGKEVDDYSMEPYFMLSEAVNLNVRKNYFKAISQLHIVLPKICKTSDFANQSIGNFYMADSYWELNKPTLALPYLLKVDSIFTVNSYIRPDLRKNYEHLINYYKNQNDKESQLKYISKLFQVDSLINTDYKYLSTKIFKEYDTAKLLHEKSIVEIAMKRQSIMYFVLLIASIILLTILTYRQLKIKNIYKKRFSELMDTNSKNTPIASDVAKDDILEINAKVSSAILSKLEKFELQKTYLGSDMTLIKIAQLLNTNTKYASKIILQYRQKKTIDYINDLKIEHIISLLRNEKKYRNYTYESLAQEAGFGSTQNFTRAFKKRCGISPTYFIREIQKGNDL